MAQTRVTLLLNDDETELLALVLERVQRARKGRVVTLPDAAKAAIRAVADQPDVELM
jgi:hypothetical protein